MLISIIIPTYSPGEYLYECLNSLSVQTSGTASFEVIIVLNGTKEPYYSNIEKYLSRQNFKFNLLYTEETGVSNARNLALDAIKSLNSQFVIFLDDDDMLSPNYIETVSSKAQLNSIIASNSKSFLDRNGVIERKGYVSDCYEKNISVPYNIFSYRCLLSNVTGKLFPISVIGNTRFNKRFSVGEDALFAFEISDRIQEIVLTGNGACYLRRLRQASASRKKRNRLSKFKNACKLSIAYSKIYLYNPFKYDILFFFSRIFATFAHVIKRDSLSSVIRLPER